MYPLPISTYRVIGALPLHKVYFTNIIGCRPASTLRLVHESALCLSELLIVQLLVERPHALLKYKLPGRADRARHQVGCVLLCAEQSSLGCTFCGPRAVEPSGLCQTDCTQLSDNGDPYTSAILGCHVVTYRSAVHNMICRIGAVQLYPQVMFMTAILCLVQKGRGYALPLHASEL